jgi:GNAT superfamily N-acetyltransferase
VYSVEQIATNNPCGYEGLCYPHFRPTLRNCGSDLNIVALGAMLEDQPIGLLLAQITEGKQRSAAIRSLVVSRPHRGTGVAASLLRNAEREFIVRSCDRAEISYMSDLESQPALESLLKKNGWRDPTLHGVFCRTNYTLVSQAPWVQRKWTLPPDIHMFKWNEITLGEREYILRLGRESNWFRECLNPFIEEETIEPRVSFGLRKANNIIGWCILCCADAETLKCTSLFVEPEFQLQGYGVALLAKSILLTGKTEYRSFVFDVSPVHPEMVRFVYRRMAPYLTSIRTSKAMSKKLLKGDDCPGPVA